MRGQGTKAAQSKEMIKGSSLVACGQGPGFHCWGPPSIPGQGRTRKPWGVAKKRKKEKKDDERKDSSLVLYKEMIKKEMSRDCTDRGNNVNYPFIHSINKYSAEQLHTKHLCDKQNEEQKNS